MKTKRLYLCGLLGVLGGLGLSACGEKNDDATVSAGGGGSKEVALKAVAGDPAPAPAGDLAAVAKATGFARLMPNTTHAYIGIYDGKGFVDEIRKSALLKLAEEQLGENLLGGNPDFDLENLEENPEVQMITALLGEEIFLGVGNDVSGQLSNLVAFNESYSRHSMKALVQTATAFLTGEGPDENNPEAALQASLMPLLGGLIGDPKGGMGVLEKAQMPPLTLGFKVSDEEKRGQLFEIAAQGIGAMLEEIGPDGEGFAEAVNLERAGSKFTGLRIKGEELVASMPPDVKEGLAQFMDAATVDKLMKILESKNIVVAIGVHENYLVGFLGSSADDLQIAASPAESLLSRPEAAFMKSFAGKRLLSFATVSKELQDSSKGRSIFGSMATGLKEGLAETEAFGDLQDLEVLLGLIAEQERAILNLHTFTPGGSVAFLEEGLKIEVFGGAEVPNVDLDTPRRYAGLGKDDGVFLFANWVSNPSYTEKALEYVETLGQTIYLAARQLARMDLPDEIAADFEEMTDGFGMFDEQIRPHFLELWSGLRGDLVAGLGEEGAVVVDLKGALPTVPGLPQLVVDEGKAPRIAMLAPIKDKKKLGDSWDNAEKALNGILKIVSEMTGENIPMQRPMSSEKNDLKTWFFPFPFQTDDFVLNVSVDEKNFFASTSKSYIQDLSAKLEKAEVDPAAKGAYFNVNFAALNAYLNDWIKLLEEKQDDIFGEGSPDAEDIMEALPMVKKAVAGLGELKNIRGHTRKEDGVLRTSVHFRTGK
ncbi:MAG: hypothetical protein VYA46_08830 [Verrucomicrobiota bacterium]|nr:hypothetical protein [Verrucomicrobiota bacterium]